MYLNLPDFTEKTTIYELHPDSAWYVSDLGKSLYPWLGEGATSRPGGGLRPALVVY